MFADSGGPLFVQLGLTVVLGFVGRQVATGFPGGRPLAERVRQMLNRIVLWITMPVLVFQTVHTAPLGPDLIQAPAAAIAGMAGTALAAWLLLVRLFGRTPETGGLVLAASAGSVSFFGIPIVRALFGPDEARVAVYFAMLSFPRALLPPPISRGRLGGPPARGVRDDIRRPARQFLTIPVTWALVAGLVLQGLRFPVE